MNKLFVIFALFAVFSLVYCDGSDSSQEVLGKLKSKRLRKYLQSRKETIDGGLDKLEAQCPGVTEKLKSALTTFAECDDRVPDTLTICEAVNTYTLNCTEPLLKVVDDCLPERARGLPKLGLRSIVSVSDFLCKQKGESIFELLNPCLWGDVATTENSSSSEETDECEDQVKSKLAKYGDTVPNTNDVCSLFTDLRGCIQNRTTKTCKNPKTREVALGLYDALVAPCSDINQV